MTFTEHKDPTSGKGSGVGGRVDTVHTVVRCGVHPGIEELPLRLRVLNDVRASVDSGLSPCFRRYHSRVPPP